MTPLISLPKESPDGSEKKKTEGIGGVRDRQVESATNAPHCRLKTTRRMKDQIYKSKLPYKTAFLQYYLFPVAINRDGS